MGRARLAAGAVTVIECVGEFTSIEDGNQVSGLVSSRMEQGDRHFIVDLSKVSHFNVDALGGFMKSYEVLTGNGGSFKLAALPNSVERVMKTTKMDKTFEIYPDVAQARSSYTERGAERQFPDLTIS